MSHSWQLQEAKRKFSEVIDAALTEGPQIITRRGIETAVVLSFPEYRQLVLGCKKLSGIFKEYPLAGLDIDLQRDNSPVRGEIEF